MPNKGGNYTIVLGIMYWYVTLIFSVICKEGYYHNLVTDSCSKCEKGTYQPTSGNTTCVSCPAGTTTRYDGANADTDCQGRSVGNNESYRSRSLEFKSRLGHSVLLIIDKSHSFVFH